VDGECFCLLAHNTIEPKKPAPLTVHPVHKKTWVLLTIKNLEEKAILDLLK
jgi:hypothetical protein